MSGQIQKILDRFQAKMDHLLKKLGWVHFYLAISGGVDSMALLDLFYQYAKGNSKQFSLSVLHFNHQLRGEASDGDRDLVRETCQKLGIPFIEGSPQEDLKGQGNLEARAREARYQFFSKAIRSEEDQNDQARSALPILVLAHHAGDQTETVFLHLIQGAGLRGLGGMASWEKRGEGEGAYYLFRPLLNFEKKDLEAYCQDRGIPWREDASNQDIRYQRNFLRNQVIPLIKKNMNSNLDQTVTRNTRLVQEELGLLKSWQKEALQKVLGAASPWLDYCGQLFVGKQGTYYPLDSAAWSALPLALQKSIMKDLLGPLSDWDRLDQENIQRACQFVRGEGGRQLNFCGIMLVYIQEGAILFSETEYLNKRSQAGEEAPFCIQLTGQTLKGRLDWSFPPMTFTWKEASKRPRFDELKKVDSCFLQLEEGDLLEVKPGQSNEHFRKFAGGTKPLRRVFTDYKLPVQLRSSYPVFYLNGRVIWLPGLARARGAEIGDGKEDKKILQITGRLR